jgi:hypothetical protein
MEFDHMSCASNLQAITLSRSMHVRDMPQSRACDNSAMNVTMKDIARELGLSIGTVSKVLRDHPDISQETRERVRKRMQELHYRPNLAARALVTGKTHTVGLVVPDLVHPFFGEVARGLRHGARRGPARLDVLRAIAEAPKEGKNIAQGGYLFSVVATSRCDVRAACSGATPSNGSVARIFVPPATTRAGTAQRAIPTRRAKHVLGRGGSSPKLPVKSF